MKTAIEEGQGLWVKSGEAAKKEALNMSLPKVGAPK